VSEGPKQLYDFLARFIFQASMASIFNEEAGENKALFDAFMAFDKDMAYCAGGLPLEYFKSAVTARETLVKACNQYVENLSELMAQRWQLFRQVADEGKMKFEDAAKEQLAILWASVGNTMPATFWLIYYLITNKKALSQLRQEMKESIRDLSMTADISQEELNRLVFADACITETLRLSSGSLIMRVARADISLTLASGKTYQFRKGDRIGLCPPLFHHDEEIFPQPEEFNPWRWLQGETMEEKLSAANGKIPMFKGGQALQR
jgi:cytochrome P450